MWEWWQPLCLLVLTPFLICQLCTFCPSFGLNNKISVVKPNFLILKRFLQHKLCNYMWFIVFYSQIRTQTAKEICASVACALAWAELNVWEHTSRCQFELVPGFSSMKRFIISWEKFSGVLFGKYGLHFTEWNKSLWVLLTCKNVYWLRFWSPVTEAIWPARVSLNPPFNVTLKPSVSTACHLMQSHHRLLLHQEIQPENISTVWALLSGGAKDSKIMSSVIRQLVLGKSSLCQWSKNIQTVHHHHLYS